MLARHGLIREHQAALGAGSERDRLPGEANGLPAVRTLDDHEDPTLILARIARCLVEQRRDVGSIARHLTRRHIVASTRECVNTHGYLWCADTSGPDRA